MLGILDNDPSDYQVEKKHQSEFAGWCRLLCFFSGVQLGNEVSFRLMKAGVLEKCFAGFLRLGLVQRYI